MKARFKPTTVIALLLLIVCTQGEEATAPWNVIEKTGSDIKSGILELSISKEEFRDTRPLDIVKADAEADAQRLKRGMSVMKPDNGHSTEEWNNRIVALMQSVRNTALERAKTGSVESYHVTLYFSGDDFALVADPNTERKNKESLYKHGNVQREYWPEEKRVVVSFFKQVTSARYEPVQVPEWLKPGRLFAESKALPQPSVASTDGSLQIKYSWTKGSLVYVLAPKMQDVLLSKTLTNNTDPRFVSETTYSGYPATKPYVPSTITTTFTKGEWRTMQMRSTVTDAKWNVPVPDGDFFPKDLPVVTVQDDRFVPTLFYQAIGTLPSDVEVERFHSDPVALSAHDHLVSPGDH